MKHGGDAAFQWLPERSVDRPDEQDQLSARDLSREMLHGLRRCMLITLNIEQDKARGHSMLQQKPESHCEAGYRKDVVSGLQQFSVE